MLRYKTKTRPGLVALYDIRPGNGAGPFLQPRSPHGAPLWVRHCVSHIACRLHWWDPTFTVLLKHNFVRIVMHFVVSVICFVVYYATGNQMYFDAALTTLVNDNIYHNGDKYYMDPNCSIELVMNTVDNVSQPVQPENVTASTSMQRSLRRLALLVMNCKR